LNNAKLPQRLETDKKPITKTTTIRHDNNTATKSTNFITYNEPRLMPAAHAQINYTVVYRWQWEHWERLGLHQSIAARQAEHQGNNILTRPSTISSWPPSQLFWTIFSACHIISFLQKHLYIFA